MKQNGSKRREVVNIDNDRYVVLRRSGERLVLQKLRGDFRDNRLILGLTQNEMADLLGIDASLLSRLENGERVLTLAVQDAARALLKEANKTGVKK